MTFLNNLTFYSWQIISHLKELILVPFGILIEFLLNRKRAAIYTVFPTFFAGAQQLVREECRPVLCREPCYSFLETLKPI